MTDTERMDWLDKKDRNWTFWLGYRTSCGGHCVWPVFPGDSIRAEIDAAIERDQLWRAKAVQV